MFKINYMAYLNTIHRKSNQYQEDRKLIPQIKYLISKQQSIISYFDVHNSNFESACPQNTIIINPMVTNYLSHEDEKILKKDAKIFGQSKNHP